MASFQELEKRAYRNGMTSGMYVLRGDGWHFRADTLDAISREISSYLKIRKESLKKSGMTEKQNRMLNEWLAKAPQYGFKRIG
jgi:hypothetical protein